MKLFLTIVLILLFTFPAYTANKVDKYAGCIVVDNIVQQDGYFEDTENSATKLQYKITNKSSKTLLALYGIIKLTLEKNHKKSYAEIKTVLYQGSLAPNSFTWQEDGYIVDTDKLGKILKCTISIKAADVKDAIKNR